MPLPLGIAQCEHCGAKVGTVFDETVAQPVEGRGKKIRAVADRVDYFQRVEDAKERANSSVILGLVSFIPMIGLALGLWGVVLSILSLKALQSVGVEEGRGQATAGLVIGLLGIIAQVCYGVYAMSIHVFG